MRFRCLFGAAPIRIIGQIILIIASPEMYDNASKYEFIFRSDPSRIAGTVLCSPIPFTSDVYLVAHAKHLPSPSVLPKKRASVRRSQNLIIREKGSNPNIPTMPITIIPPAWCFTLTSIFHSEMFVKLRLDLLPFVPEAWATKVMGS